jgi:DNA polymerase (family 10)
MTTEHAMPIPNLHIADIFNRIADLLDIKGDNPFRIRAYRDAARTVGDLSGNVADMVEKGEDPAKLPGIGKDLAAKIREMVATGSLSFLQKLEEEVPGGLIDLLRISGLGPRKVGRLYRELGITSLVELKTALKDKKVRQLDGFGEKTEQNISEKLERLSAGQQRQPGSGR